MNFITFAVYLRECDGIKWLMLSRRFVIPDIHGCACTFLRLLEEVIRLEKTDALYLLGDYIDRGPRSNEVLDLLMEYQDRGYTVHPLRGNHEEMFIQAHESDASFRLWLHNGGYATLDSFKVQKIDDIPSRYREFLLTLPYYIALDDLILVHGGLNFQIPDPFTDSEAMIWSRSSKVDKELIGGRRVICGHTPHSLNSIRESLTADLIMLDNGCVYNHPELGNLTALELDTMTLYFQPNID
ncbi:MAG: serine/threonine protein phosphatase [Geobacteraceae bacterium]|nr:MAG: serine/threonine protein phosphatase [Geobacteraceae bacterium]